MVKVLISDKLSPRAEEIFRARGIDVEVETGLDPEALVARIGAYEGLAVRSATKVTAELLAAAERLRVVGRAGIGVDNIDVSAATTRGVVVMNTPFGNAITTAEHAIAMIFALARRIPAADRSTRAGKWEKSRFMGIELTGKTLGVIGCGNVGSIVSERALGLKMRVIVYDPYLAPERAADLGIERVDLDELLARADIVTLHTPLTDATRHMIDARAIAKMKPGVMIVNCARGGLVVESDLRVALVEGRVGGAALDVFEVEPATDNPLFERDDVVTTPHLGAATAEAQENVAIQVAEQISDYLLSGAVTNAVNMAPVNAEDAPKLEPYARLAEQLGSFAGQLTETGLRKVKVEYEGQAAELGTRPLTAAVLAGLLSPLLDTVNMVNAPVIARQRDIDVTEVRNERAGDYQTCIRLTVTTEKRSRSVCGTLFGGDKPRIIEVDGVAVEAELGANMLFIRNEDKPGFVGNLGGVLAEAGVNIATFHLGREARGGQALALIKVDDPISAEVLEKVRALPHVVQVKTLSF